MSVSSKALEGGAQSTTAGGTLTTTPGTGSGAVVTVVVVLVRTWFLECWASRRRAVTTHLSDSEPVGGLFLCSDEFRLRSSYSIGSSKSESPGYSS